MAIILKIMDESKREYVRNPKSHRNCDLTKIKVMGNNNGRVVIFLHLYFHFSGNQSIFLNFR